MSDEEACDPRPSPLLGVPSQPSSPDSRPSWRLSEVHALIATLKDASALCDRVTSTEVGRPTAQHARDAEEATADALRAWFRLLIRLDRDMPR